MAEDLRGEMKALQHLEKLLKPRGTPLGTPKRKGSKVRHVAKERDYAEELFEELAALGCDAPTPTYPGRRIEIRGIGYVGYREVSKSGDPTIDIRVTISGLEDIKLKFVGHEQP